MKTFRVNMPGQAIAWALLSTMIVSIHDALTEWLTAVVL